MTPAALIRKHNGWSANKRAGMAVILYQPYIDVFTGLDVGKSGQRAVALDKAGRNLFDKAGPTDET